MSCMNELSNAPRSGTNDVAKRCAREKIWSKSSCRAERIVVIIMAFQSPHPNPLAGVANAVRFSQRKREQKGIDLD